MLRNVLTGFLTSMIILSCALPATVSGTNCAEAKKYISKFEREFGVKIEYAVLLDDFDTSAAVCMSWPFGRREVKINRRYWNTINDAQREELLYHEFGHCSFGLTHNSQYMHFDDMGLAPYSIMHPTAFSIAESEIYVIYREHYIDQMKEAISARTR